MLCRQILFEYLITQDVGWMARRKVKQSRRAKKVLTIVTARLFPSRCDIRQNVTRKTRAERKKGEGRRTPKMTNGTRVNLSCRIRHKIVAESTTFNETQRGENFEFAHATA
jgi:hypothetical protein